jgi:hypothetical protein
MKYLILILSSLFLCENSLAASAETPTEDAADGRKSPVARTADGLVDLDSWIEKEEEEYEVLVVAARKAIEEENAARKKRNKQLKEEFIKLDSYDVEESGPISLSPGIAEIIEEISNLGKSDELNKIQKATINLLDDELRAKLTKEGQEKVTAAFSKLPTT